MRSIASCPLLNGRRDPWVDELVRVAAALTDCPISIASIVEGDRQWFLGSVGLSVDHTLREVSFCAHAILGDGPLVVEDATTDKRFSDNALVTNSPGIRFYAGAPIVGVDGLPLGTVCVIDTVARKISEERLHALSSLSHLLSRYLDASRRSAIAESRNEALMAQGLEVTDLLAACPGALYRCKGDERRTMQFISDAILEITGYPPADFLENGARNLCGLIHPDDREMVIERSRTAVARGEAWDIEYRVIHADGSTRWVADRGRARGVGVMGGAQGCVGVIQDITERKRLEQEVHESARWLNAHQHAIDTAGIVAVTDNRGTITHVNENFCRISGYSRGELIGQNHRMLNSGRHQREFFREMYLTISRGSSWRGEICNRAKNGSLYWVDTTIVPVVDVDGIPREYIALRIDITARKQMEERITLAAEGSSDGLFDYDTMGGVCWFSPRFEELLGLRSGELGTDVSRWDELVHADDRYRVTEAFHLHLVNGENLDVECRLRVARENYRWFRVRSMAIRGQDGLAQRIAGSISDIDALKRRESELIEARHAAETAAQAKSDFLANMSHEIRTPMTAILGFADLLEIPEGTAGSSQTADAIRTIRSNAYHLLTVINDILDVSKIEAGKMRIERLPTNPAHVVEEVASVLRPRAIGKGIDLRISYESRIPARIETDPTRLRQIMLNLVGNAVKFTENGFVTILVSASRQDGLMRFSVVDTGIGMTPEQRELIARFEAFSQADGSTTRKFGGTGLGLRISNSLAKLLGGKIEIDSKQGQGSTFTLSIDVGSVADAEFVSIEQVHDLAHAAAEPERAKKTEEQGQPLKGVRILFAEDGPDNQRLVSHHLKKAGAEVILAENGLRALEAYDAAAKRGEQFALILMDMQMPELDGYGATRRLRAQGCELPIIALTAHSMDGDRQKCVDAGCDDYLTKPIDRARMIETCLSWSTARRRSAAA